MAHYNLYDSLKLDNNASSDDIVALLEKRIQEGELDNLGGLEEVNLAKKILGNPENEQNMMLVCKILQLPISRSTQFEILLRLLTHRVPVHLVTLDSILRPLPRSFLP